ncbi:MAG: FAD-dependent oxidoreductase [Pseudomonadota bacterium]
MATESSDRMTGLGARGSLADLDGSTTDVLIVGGGINGSASAQHLAAEGYRVLLVEKGDYASAASSRSSRLLHCGLRYLAPERSPLEFLTRPSRLKTALGMAVGSLRARREFLAATPERLRPLDMAIPIYRGDAYPGWMVDAGAALLGALNAGGPPIRYQRLAPGKAAAAHPLVAIVRDQPDLASVFSFRDYQFDWPERLCFDALLRASDLGARVRNYTAVTALESLEGGHWRATLEDQLGSGESAVVEAQVLLNLTGVWIDGLNQKAAPESPPSRKIVAVKGVHIAVRLPDRYRGYGIAGLNREHEHFFCLPFGDLHYIGPTETVYEGDIEHVHPDEEDVRFLLDEVNFMLPELALRRQDVALAWAGARPITFDPTRAKGRRTPANVFHELGGEGMGNALTVTWGWIMHHRTTAQRMVQRVRRLHAPDGPRRPVTYAAVPFPENTNTLPLVPEVPEVTTGVLRHLAATEQPAQLVDLLFRRAGVSWRARLSRDSAQNAADAVADILGWDAERVRQEVDNYLDYVRVQHLQD